MIEFLCYLYESGLAYRTINVARSALSMTLLEIEGHRVGAHPLVCRVMKGIFHKRPPQASLTATWSVNKVLETLASWSPANSLSTKCLTLKTAMLLALATGKRCH